uniref:Uncharacterized protein n=1 Tax=Arundo donax TaxID=35708 RepID=A0A0A9E440_ARUDO
MAECVVAFIVADGRHNSALTPSNPSAAPMPQPTPVLTAAHPIHFLLHSLLAPHRHLQSAQPRSK